MKKSGTKKYLILLMVIFSTAAWADLFAENSSLNILVINTYNDMYPWSQDTKSGLDQARKAHPQVQFFNETIDATRLKNSLSYHEWGIYLSQKYKYIRFDGIIGISQQGSEVALFISSYFGEIPVVTFSDIIPADSSLDFSLKSEIDRSIEETLKLALRQNPKTKEVVLLFFDELSNIQIRNYLEKLMLSYPELSLSIITKKTLQEWKNAVRSVSQDSVIFYTLILADNQGNIYVPKEVLQELTEISPVPIYTFWSSLAGTGIAGGVMTDGEIVAQSLVNALFDRIEKGEYQNHYETLKTTINWKTVRKYDLNQKKNDSSVEYLNLPKPIYVTYFNELMYIALFMMASFILLTLLWNKKIQKTRDQLRKSNQNLEIALSESSALFSHSHVGMMLVGENDIIKKVNKRFCQILGAASPEELTGKKADVLNLTKIQESQIQHLYEKYLSKGLIFENVVEISGNQKENLWIKIIAAPLDLEKPPNLNKGIIWIIDDITNQVKADQLKQQSQKNEVIAQITGGIGHEVNNSLTKIMGSAELALLEEHNPEIKTHLETIIEVCSSSAELTEQLLSISHNKRFSKRNFTADTLIQSIISENRNPGIEMLQSEGDEHISLFGDSSQLKKALNFLVKNAIESMPEGGRIRLSQHIDKENQDCLIKIQDEGMGITEEQMKKIFNPFYTTKKLSTNSGLGLSAAQGIVKNHGGFIDMQSTPGKGSIFTVHIPLS